jgi:3-oxoacyl-(acyl-carrier-protein) synthase
VRPVVVIGQSRLDSDSGRSLAAAAGKPVRLARMDRYTRLALLCADAAVHDAGLDPVRWPAERVALVLGSAAGCYESNALFREALAQGEPSPRVFAATLPSTPLGEIAIALGAAGPQLCFAQGGGSGLLALAEGRRLLLSGRAELALCGACDALPDSLRGALSFAPKDGASFFVLARGEHAPGKRRGAILGGGSAFGPSARADAVRAACHEGGFDLAPTEHPAGLAGALGGGRPALLVDTDSLGGVAALILS